MRKHNYIEAYYDEFGTLEGKSNSRLFPHANYQSMLYANFEDADQENVVGASFYLDDGTQKNELPMKFVGYFSKGDKRYARWELPIPSDIVKYFKPDRETQMSVKFLEYEPFDFEGFYDVYGDLPTGDDAPEDDAIAYVLQEEDGNEEGLYQYDEENDEWNEEEEPTIEHAEVIWASSLFDITVSRSFRVEREPVEKDTTDIILQTIAKLQSDLYDLKYTEGVVETNNENDTSFWIGTQDEYDNLSEYDDNTIYLIEED